MKYQDIERMLHEAAGEAAEIWWELGKETAGCGRAYLYYTMATEGEKMGQLNVSQDRPEDGLDWILASVEPLSYSWTVGQCHYQIFQIIKQLPILSTDI